MSIRKVENALGTSKTNPISQNAASRLPINTRNITNTPTGNYTLALSDLGGMVRMDFTNANVLTFPNDTAVPLEVGFQGTWEQSGVGQISFMPQSGVTINSFFDRAKSAGKTAGGTFVKTGPNTFSVYGMLVQ